MPVWTKADYVAYQARRLSSSAKPEPAIRHDAVGAVPRKAADAEKVVVSITSYRRRLLDPDNLIGGAKYFVDGLRYAGLIPGDAPDKITLIVQQRKNDLERTEIELI